MVDNINTVRRFGALSRLYPDNLSHKVFSGHVAIVGLGGVGSWAAEALARTGVAELTLIDFDHIAESNINRQIHALSSTLGMSKIHALAQRIAEINPNCRVHLVDDFLDADNIDDCLKNTPNVLLDCADQFNAKLAMILYAKQHGIRLVVCGGAGGKTDALSIKGGDLSIATHDALLSKLRYQLRKKYRFPSPRQGSVGRKTPKMGVDCLWFDQAVIRPSQACLPSDTSAPQGLSCAGYGSLVTVTATMGMAAAQKAIDFLSLN